MKKFIAAIIISFTTSKTAKFIYEVFEGMVGEVLDAVYPIINEAVKNTENIGNYIKAHTELTNTELVKKIAEIYGYKLTCLEVEYVKTHEIKGYGKYLIAYTLIKNRLELEGKKVTPSIINLGIELAVSRYFGKKQ